MLRVGVELIVRWASALPVRRALVLQEFGRQGLGGEKARLRLSEQPRDYVIELAGIPHMLVKPEFERQLRQARLSVPGSRTLSPLSVELPGIGTHVTARMAFTRVENVAPEAGVATFSLEAEDLKIKQDFKLRSMVYEGRLEL
jgi:hypothetical protein